MQTVLHISQFDKVSTLYTSSVHPSERHVVGYTYKILEDIFAQAQDNEWSPSACTGDLLMIVDTGRWFKITTDGFESIYPQDALRWTRLTQEERSLASLKLSLGSNE